MDWRSEALLLLNYKNTANQVHSVVIRELIEEGVLKYADNAEEIEATELGVEMIRHAQSPDYASKRY